MGQAVDGLLVEMEGITKDFPGVHALRGCSFDLRRGEVHALVGENGAGKSTLMKILAGVYRMDAGRIRLRGAETEIASPRAAQHLGISIIHQELSLMPNLTVAQNIFIGREPRGRLPFSLDERELNRQARALFERLHLLVDTSASMSVGAPSKLTRIRREATPSRSWSTSTCCVGSGERGRKADMSVLNSVRAITRMQADTPSSHSAMARPLGRLTVGLRG